MRPFDHPFSLSISLSALALIVLSPSVAGCEGPSGVADPASDDSEAIPERGPSSSAGAPGSKPAPSGTAPTGPSGPQTTDLYHSAKGDPKNQALVFIHGGPGANSKMFELAAQDSIAKLGYYVVAYDQRGSTRSPQGTAKDYSYAKATQDLDDLVGALGLSSPILIGHSFGGSLALQYLDRFKGKAKGAVLVAAPIAFPETYDTVLAQCDARYKASGRTADAKKIEALRTTMFPHGVQPPYTYTDANIGAVIACQSDAKLYFPMFPTAGELSFAASGGLDPEVAAVNDAVGSAYQANDQIGYADFTTILQAHKAEVRGIYAPQWDVMFSKHQLDVIQASTASYATVGGSGHFIFVDQPQAFSSTLRETLAQMK
jgi:proline iminopeptidase